MMRLRSSHPNITLILASYAVATTLLGLDMKNAPHRESAEECAKDLLSCPSNDVVSRLFNSAEIAKKMLFKGSESRIGSVPNAGRKQSRHESHSAF